MSKFRWLYIGNGNIAYSTARDIERGNHKVSCVYGRNSEKVKNFAKRVKCVPYKTVEEALAKGDFDGVYIATPHTSHLEYGIKALESKKPVLCEKPIAVTEADAVKLITCAKEKDVYFCEAMWTWFGKVANTVKKWVNDGEIGEITEVNIDYAFPGLMMSKDSRVLTPETAGGALLDVGIYPITYCYRIFGYPDKIECTGEIKNGIDVAETVVLTYGKTKCTLKMSLSHLKEGCEIIGTKGKIKVPMFHMASFAVMKKGAKIKFARGKTNYLNEFTKVAEEIKAEKKESEVIPFSATIDCLRIMDECRKQMNLVYPFEK